MTETHIKLSLSEKAVLLINQLKRNPDVMPPYNDEIMRACIQGIEELYQEMAITKRSVETGEASQESLQMNKYRMDMVKYVIRCCNAYLLERQTRIKSYRWKFGGALPTSVRNNLCEEEIEFFSSYCETLAKFQIKFGDSGPGLDLMMSTHPPKTLFMMVRVRENYGEFETSTGKLVNLQSGSIHNLPRQDCEMLIKQGILEIAN